MYSNYFGMDEPPFSIAPNPRYLFLSKQHREALAHLLYGISSNGGFVLLTGEVGTGKTTVCRALLDQLPENTDVALILNPKFSSEELLAAICDELKISYPDSDDIRLKDYVDALNSYLLNAHAQGRNTVLILDEAQNLGVSVLEQIRLLTNLETDCSKLLQIVLIGQPELLNQLQRSELRQLSQRITARFHLGALNRSELESYISHRLSVAGVQGKLFPDSTINKLYRITHGIPRLINIVCDRALLGAFVERHNRVEISVLNKAAEEALGEKSTTWPTAFNWQMVALLIMAIAALSWSFRVQLSDWTSNFGAALNPGIIAAENNITSVAGPAPATLLATKSFTGEAEEQLNQVLAYRALFRLWGINYQPRKNPIICKYARKVGYDCLFSSGSIERLLELNRPAVIKLANSYGDFYATLTSVKNGRAQLIIDEQLLELPLSDLNPFWRNTYTVFWQLPPGYDGMIQPGIQQQNILWLTKQMAKINGSEVTSDNSFFYGPPLVRQVKQFQLSKGLLADGIIGPRTAIHLNTATQLKVPKLIQDG